MNIFKRVVRIFAYLGLVIATLLIILCGFNSDHLSIHTYALSSDKVIDNFSCLVISDFHHRSLKFTNTDLVSAIKRERADAIFFTGDMIDSHAKNLDDVKAIFRASCSITPNLYYVTGNHEGYAPLWNELNSILPDFGIKEMDALFNADDFMMNNIKIFGLPDPRIALNKEATFKEEETILRNKLEEFKEAITSTTFNILLTHRPEYMDLYSEYGFDMVTAGHTHGGQIKIGNFSLGINGYSSGEYTKNNTTMYVSKGLGHAALFPLRINCDPEIVKISIN